MDVLRLRILARKSVMGFGYSDKRDLSIQQLLDIRSHSTLIKAYYGLDRISFSEDILDELKITKDLRIEKPGKIKCYDEQKAACRKVYDQLYGNMTEEERIKRWSTVSSYAKKIDSAQKNSAFRTQTKVEMSNFNRGHKVKYN